MKIMRIFLFLLLLFDLNFGQTPPKQQMQVQEVFDSFENSLDKLSKRFGKNSPLGIKADIARTLEGIAENVRFLKAVMNLGKPIPREYLEGVALDAKLLKKIACQKSNTAARRKRLYYELKEVESDLILKVTGPRSGGEITRVVEVFVHARKGAQNVGAYQVWYVTNGWAKYPSHFRPFDRLTDPSNPSSMKLAPGNYFIWLRQDKLLTQRQPASIGENGETQRVIQVPVP